VHVGLNMVFLVPGETGGMEIYARELVAALTRVAPEIRLTAFLSREGGEHAGDLLGDAVRPVVLPVNARRRPEWVLGEQWHVPGAARRVRCDLVHSLATTGPAVGGPIRVTTVHDLIYKIHPEAHMGLRTYGMRVLVPLSVRRSHRLIAVSQATADDLVRLMGIPRERIDVIPEGVGRTAPAAPTPEPELRRRLDARDRPIVLSASAKRPHKNLMRLLEALAQIDPAERPVLVLPGYETPHEAELRARATELGLDGDVRFLGWVSSADLEGLYAASACFVFPSLYEGFGLPVLEAMKRGVPVACSRGGSLGEVAGDAALTFDPESVGEIAAAMRRLLADRELADRLRSAGYERVQTFDWDETARRTAETYRRATGTRSGSSSASSSGTASDSSAAVPPA
jgi:glycosyltransferase involved in cell wall biosynthesis